MKSYHFDKIKMLKKFGTHTKNNNIRKGKTVITPRRAHLRRLAWEKLRSTLREHLRMCARLNIIHEQARIARVLGTSQSQIHRWNCRKCEHNQEPGFTMGIALAIYLYNYNVANTK